MKTIREQAKIMGHAPKGALKRMKDDVFYKDGIEIHNKIYLDEEGVEYAVNRFGKVVYISGGDWVI